MTIKEKRAVSTNGTSKLEATIDRLNCAIEECREVTREAHAATKDLRRVMADARQILEHDTQAVVDAHILEAVKVGLEIHAEVRQKADEAMAATVTEFDARIAASVAELNGGLADLRRMLFTEGFVLSLAPQEGSAVHLMPAGSPAKRTKLDLTQADGKKKRLMEL